MSIMSFETALLQYSILTAVASAQKSQRELCTNSFTRAVYVVKFKNKPSLTDAIGEWTLSVVKEGMQQYESALSTLLQVLYCKNQQLEEFRQFAVLFVKRLRNGVIVLANDLL